MKLYFSYVYIHLYIHKCSCVCVCVLDHFVNFISYCRSGSKKFEQLSWKGFFALGVDSRFQLLLQRPCLWRRVVSRLIEEQRSQAPPA